MERAIIYPIGNNHNHDIKGECLPYFYLDGIAEELAGYDCVNSDHQAVIFSLARGFFLVDIEYHESYEQDTKLGIVFCKYHQNRMAGRIVLVDDLNMIERIVDFVSISGYDDDCRKLRDNYPDTWKLIKTMSKE